MKNIKTFFQKNIWRLLISTIFALCMTSIGVSTEITDISSYSSIELTSYLAFAFGVPFTIQWFLIPQIIDCY